MNTQLRVNRPAAIIYSWILVLVGASTAPALAQDAIFVDLDGDVGFGDSTPDASLDIERDGPEGAKLVVESTVPGGVNGLVALELKNNGGHIAFQIDSGVTGLPGGGDAAWDFSAATGGSFRFSRIGTGVTELFVSPGGDMALAGDLTVVGGCTGCDAVFSPDWDLETIEEHAEQMWHDGHLPGIGPTPEGKSSIRVFQKMTGMLMELEKAHIYIEQLNDRLEEKHAQVRALEERLARLEAESGSNTAVGTD
jgi:hypothetical protein